MVTSVLSKGYLLPSRNPLRTERESAAPLAAQERQILAQEQAMKMASGAGAKVSATYRYTLGPDGRRYITGAEITVEGDEQAVDRVGGGVKREVGERPAAASEKTAGKENSDKENSEKENAKTQAVRELQATEREVVAHEAAHKAAGGSFAGAVSYTTTRGPDGKSYITGGEVPIHVPSSSDPEETLRNMEQVQRAAMAPGSPSGQDLSVAAQAASAAAQARQQMSADSLKEGDASVRAGLRYERIQAGEDGQKETSSPKKWMEAYARGASPYGLWSPKLGFERNSSLLPPAAREPGFDIAA